MLLWGEEISGFAAHLKMLRGKRLGASGASQMLRGRRDLGLSGAFEDAEWEGRLGASGAAMKILRGKGEHSGFAALAYAAFVRGHATRLLMILMTLRIALW